MFNASGYDNNERLDGILNMLYISRMNLERLCYRFG